MGEPCRLRQVAAGMDDIQEKIEDFVVEYVWDDEDGKGLGGKQFGDTVSEYWGSVSSGAATASSWSWAVGTTCVQQPPLPRPCAAVLVAYAILVVVGRVWAVLVAHELSVVGCRALVVFLPVAIGVELEQMAMMQEAQMQMQGAPAAQAPASGAPAPAQ